MVKKPIHGVFMPLVAGILAWAIPGAGHVYLGRTVRGVILCACIHALFWSGLAMGGVFTVEPLRERWWFAAQMLTGVSGGAAWYLQDQRRRDITRQLDLKPRPPARQTQAEAYEAARWWQTYSAALADRKLTPTYPADSAARAYSGIAGLLNLMCIFDAFMLALLGKLGEPPRDLSRPAREKAA